MLFSKIDYKGIAISLIWPKLNRINKNYSRLTYSGKIHVSLKSVIFGMNINNNNEKN